MTTSSPGLPERSDRQPRRLPLRALGQQLSGEPASVPVMQRRGGSDRSKGTAKLKDLRLRSGYSQAELADATGIGIRTLQRWEGDKMESPPPVWYLVNCAVVLGCSIEDLSEDKWLQFYEDKWYYYHPEFGPDPRGKTARLRTAR